MILARIVHERARWFDLGSVSIRESMGGGGEKTFSQLNSADERTANIHHCMCIFTCKITHAQTYLVPYVWAMYMCAASDVVTYADVLCSTIW